MNVAIHTSIVASDVDLLHAERLGHLSGLLAYTLHREADAFGSWAESSCPNGTWMTFRAAYLQGFAGKAVER